MLNAITLSQIYVLDQQEAVDFYVGKLGMVVKNDIDMGFMRWLTVALPEDQSREVLLEVPGPPAMDPATAERVRDLVTKGATGGWIGFTCTDIYAVYENLRAQGVEFTQEPVERFYGIDCGLRDPFGNAIRISQMKPEAEWGDPRGA